MNKKGVWKKSRGPWVDTEEFNEFKRKMTEDPVCDEPDSLGKYVMKCIDVVGGKKQKITIEQYE